MRFYLVVPPSYGKIALPEEVNFWLQQIFIFLHVYCTLNQTLTSSKSNYIYLSQLFSVLYIFLPRLVIAPDHLYWTTLLTFSPLFIFLLLLLAIQLPRYLLASRQCASNPSPQSRKKLSDLESVLKYKLPRPSPLTNLISFLTILKRNHLACMATLELLLTILSFLDKSSWAKS